MFGFFKSTVLALASVGLFIGCGTAISPPGPTLAPGKVSLRVATGDSGEGLVPHREIIRQFEAANPGIEIQLEVVGGENYYDTLSSQIKAGTAPDIMQIGDDAVPRFVGQGAFVDLDPYIKGNQPLDLNIYLPGVIQPGAWQGRQYFLPKDFTPLAVYYNKKIFQTYRVPYPRDGWTWYDLQQTARLLTVDSDHDGKTDIWGVQLPAAWTSGFEYWVAAAGGTLVGEDGVRLTGHLDSPETIAALRFYADLYTKFKVAPPPVGISLFGGGNREFETGKAAMNITGHWPESDYQKNPLIDLGVVGMPVGRERANVLFWSGFGINSASAHKDEAWHLLQFYAGEQGARVWKDWGLPSVKSVAQSAGTTNDPLEGVWLSELNHLVPRAYIFSPRFGETADRPLRKALEQAIVDPGADPASLLKQAATEAQAAMDERK